jgi:hypothetical protein
MTRWQRVAVHADVKCYVCCWLNEVVATIVMDRVGDGDGSFGGWFLFKWLVLVLLQQQQQQLLAMAYWWHGGGIGAVAVEPLAHFRITLLAHLPSESLADCSTLPLWRTLAHLDAGRFAPARGHARRENGSCDTRGSVRW